MHVYTTLDYLVSVEYVQIKYRSFGMFNRAIDFSKDFMH